MNDRNFGVFNESTNTFDPSSALSGAFLDHDQNIVGEPLSSAPLAMPSFEDKFKAFLKEQKQGAGESEIGENSNADGQSATGFSAPTDFSIDQVVAHFPGLDTALDTGAQLFDTGSALVEQTVESGSLLAKDTIQVVSNSVRDILQDAVESWNDPDNSVHNALNHKLDETVEEVSELADSMGRSHWWARVKQRFDNAVDATSSFTEKISESLGSGAFSSDISKEEAALESATARLADNLMDLTADPDLEATLKTAFGDDVNSEKAAELIHGLAQGESGPEIVVIDEGSLLGEGAFGDNKIFVSNKLVAESVDNPGLLDGVLLEETGHYLDQELNGGVDSSGDEGDIFAQLAQGKILSKAEVQLLKREDDSSVLLFNNKSINVENFSIFGNDDDDSGIINTVKNVVKKVPKPLIGAAATNPIVGGAVVGYGAYKGIQSLGNDDEVTRVEATLVESKDTSDTVFNSPPEPPLPHPSEPQYSESPATPSSSSYDSRLQDEQQLLADLGYDLTPDGHDGPITDSAIRQFQSDNNLTVDGDIGPETRAALEESLAGNSHDQELEQYQQQLDELGYDITSDGHDGPITDSAIRQFQSDNNLTVDGDIGPETRAALEANLSSQATSSGTPIDDTGTPISIESGDTLSEIAAQHDVEVTDLRKSDGTKFTEADARKLEVGSQVVVPGATQNSDDAEPSNSEVVSDTGALPGNSSVGIDGGGQPSDSSNQSSSVSRSREPDNILPADSIVPIAYRDDGVGGTDPGELEGSTFTESETEIQQVDQPQVDDALDEISKLLHTDRQSGWTPWTDGDREVTGEEVSKVYKILEDLDEREAAIVFANLSKGQIEKIDTVLENGEYVDGEYVFGEYVESTGLGHAIAAPFRVIGRGITGSFDTIAEATTNFSAGVSNGLAQGLLRKGTQGNFGSNPKTNPFPRVETPAEIINETVTILEEGDAPIISNGLRCFKNGDNSSCGMLAVEIVIGRASGPVTAKVTSVLGRVGDKLLVRFLTKQGDEVVTAISKETTEKVFRNADGSKIDYENFGSEFVDDSLRMNEQPFEPSARELPDNVAGSTGGNPGGDLPSTGGIPNPKLRFETDLDPDDVLRLEDLRKEVLTEVEKLPKRTRSNFESKLGEDFGDTGKTIGFADVLVDGKKPLEVRAVSGKQNFEGFADYLDEGVLEPSENPTYSNRKSLPDSDVEKKILEDILEETNKDATGTIRLVVNRLACSSCSDILFDQFIKERPGLNVEVVQLYRP